MAMAASRPQRPPSTSRSHGTLILNPQLPNAQPLIYTPFPNYHGPDSFTFAFSDSLKNSTPALVAVVVTAVNDPPQALGGNFETGQGTPVTVQVITADVDGDPLNFRLLSAPAHGTTSGAGPD
jgi:hypothetical protein